MTLTVVGAPAGSSIDEAAASVGSSGEEQEKQQAVASTAARSVVLDLEDMSRTLLNNPPSCVNRTHSDTHNWRFETISSSGVTEGLDRDQR